MLSPETIGAMAAYPDVAIIRGEDINWLGIPLKTRHGTIGVLTVQNYSGMARYTEKDKELLRFVSDQIASAIELKQVQQDVRESEEQFKSAFEHSAIGMALIGLDQGHYLKVNASHCAIVGYTEAELLQMTFQDITHPDDIEPDLSQLRQLIAGNITSYKMEKRYFHKNGSIVQVRLMVSLVRDNVGRPKHHIAQIEDITEHKRAERWQRHYIDTLGLITAEAPIEVILSSLAAFAEQQADGMLCSILMLSADGKRLRFGAAPSLPGWFNEAIDGVTIGLGVGSCGTSAFTGCMVVTEDVMSSPDWRPWRELAARAGIRACWSQPILSADNKVLGTFAIYRRETSTPTPEDVQLIRHSAGLAAIAIERANYHEDQRLAKVVFEQGIEGIMVTDLDNRVLMVNESFEALTGFSAEEIVGREPDFLYPDRVGPADPGGRGDVAGDGRWRGEVLGMKKSGESYPMAMSVATVHDALGVPSHFVITIADVSGQKIQAARIEQLAFYDVLTGLPNRALFIDRLEQTLVASKRHESHGAILFLDLDRFKEINDSQGHAVGDMALAEVARRLRSVSRQEETLARMGGDEFVLIAENIDAEAAVLIATQFCNALVEPLDLHGHAYVVGASIGIALYPADGETSEDLIKHADIAMYQAKSAGGGYRLYQAAMGADLAKRLTLAKRLRQALDGGRLQLYYQPQFDLGRGCVIGAEALLRWNDPELGWVSPAEFIPIAEERGMMNELGDWVLREACRQLNAWEADGMRFEGRIAINVSAIQMEDPGVVDRLLGIVQQARLSPDRFDLELTESSMMRDPERAVQVLELLGAAGFGLSIDDFGTGYSSLSYLKRFAADQIKIDISFVRNMLVDVNDHTIVTTIIVMARSLGLKTTAEGVEHEDQAAALRSLGCDHAQGYHFGRPVAAQVFGECWLKPSPMA